MTKLIAPPRKQRTRQHVIADMSVNYVERFIIEAGHTAQRLDRDYGYDLLMSTYDEQGFIEIGFVYLQLKASESLPLVKSEYVFEVDVRDYNLWMAENAPVILVLFDASRKRAYWLDVQQYFVADKTRQPKKGSKTIRVRVPPGQAVNRRAIAQIRDLKPRLWDTTKGPK